MWGRIRQTFQALFAWLRPVDDDLARQHLSPAAFELFMRMPRSDRQHHLRVFEKLRAAGHTHPALLTAALLHDVGKTRTAFTIPDRILAVVVKKLWPARFDQWSQGRPMGWQRAFVVSAQHPAWGADMLAAIDGDPLAVQLIRYHQDCVADVPDDDTLRTLLQHLQTMDDIS